MSYTTTIKFQNGTVVIITSPDQHNMHSVPRAPLGSLTLLTAACCVQCFAEDVSSLTTEVNKRGDDSASDRDARQINKGPLRERPFDLEKPSTAEYRRIREKKVKRERRAGQERRKGLPVPEHMHGAADGIACVLTDRGRDRRAPKNKR